MSRILLLLSIVLSFRAASQVMPAEGRKLHYRLIGFTFPNEPAATGYTIEIANGYHERADSFSKNICRRAGSKTNRIIAEVPAFGRQYTWHILYKGTKRKESVLYHFSTGTNARIDTSQLRLRILQAASPQFSDHYIALETGGIVYDMTGKPVWYVPDTNGYGGNIADIKFTDDGTITFLYRNAFEIDYNGDVLWKAPDNGTVNGETGRSELYHHEFTKLSNGNYMVLGMKFTPVRSVVTKDSSYLVFSKDKSKEEKDGFKLGRFDYLIEYDSKGSVVWSWSAAKYLSETDFAYFNPADSNTRWDAHANAFYFDEKNKAIYIGFRNLNRVVKIGYPGGEILQTYGQAFKPGMQATGATFFCGQHNIGLTRDGHMYYFNNNSCWPDELPTIVMLQEPTSASRVLNKLWEYTCAGEVKYMGDYHQGGNVKEMPGSTFFINMGSSYSKLLIINRDKKTLWAALPEQFSESESKWMPVHQYRANIISRKELEAIIWAAQSSK